MSFDFHRHMHTYLYIYAYTSIHACKCIRHTHNACWSSEASGNSIVHTILDLNPIFNIYILDSSNETLNPRFVGLGPTLGTI